MERKQNKKDIAKMKEWQSSPIAFIKDVWKLTPQPIKVEYADYVNQCLLNRNYGAIKAQHFVSYVKNRDITWQQWLILKSVELAIAGKTSKKISIASGRGIGKTCCLSWLIIWYLICHYNAQVPCTAPTSEQMHDVLWKELEIWRQRMPKLLANKLEWSSGYLRIIESPETWFARARTARKENPEALAGFHGEFVMLVVDEGSGVDDRIFSVAEGALTNDNYLFIIISNARRLIGYFYDTHHSLRQSWQNLRFNSEESPIVRGEFIEDKKKHGEDSDEYRIEVLGLFPKEDAVDDKGYVPLLRLEDLHFTNDAELVGHKKLGIDPAGAGSDKTEWVARDNFRAINIATEQISNSKGIASKSLTIQTYLDIKGENTWIDNFGEGANVAAEIALAGRIRVNAVNVGKKVESANQLPNTKSINLNLSEELEFVDLRAKAYWTLRAWLVRGGLLAGTLENWKQLLTIRYCRDGQGRIKMMSKELMRKNGIDSPDKADALMLTFIDTDIPVITVSPITGLFNQKIEENKRINKENRMR